MSERFSDPDTHFRIIRSRTPVTADGNKIGEPIEVECSHCGARAAHIDGLQQVHRLWCPQRDIEIDCSHGPGFDGCPHC